VDFHKSRITLIKKLKNNYGINAYGYIIIDKKNFNLILSNIHLYMHASVHPFLGIHRHLKI
jgi:hypothetical protein